MKKTINVDDLPEFDPAKYLDNEKSNRRLSSPEFWKRTTLACWPQRSGDIARARGMIGDTPKPPESRAKLSYRALRPV